MVREAFFQWLHDQVPLPINFTNKITGTVAHTLFWERNYVNYVVPIMELLDHLKLISSTNSMQCTCLPCHYTLIMRWCYSLCVKVLFFFGWQLGGGGDDMKFSLSFHISQNEKWIGDYLELKGHPLIISQISL